MPRVERQFRSPGSLTEEHSIIDGNNHLCKGRWDIAIFQGMTRSRLLTGVALALLGLIAPCSALVSDAELDAVLQSSTASHAAGRGRERDSLIEAARMAIRARLAADESAPTALERLDRIESLTARTDKDRRSALAALKARAESGEEAAVRKAHADFLKRFPRATAPPLAELLAQAPLPSLPPAPVAPAANLDSCAHTPRAPGCRDTLPAPVARDTTPPPSLCPDGPPSAVFLRPNSHQAIVSRDSTLVLQARIHAPCMLRELVLLSDSFPARRVDFPAGRSGTFEFDDAISVPPAAQVLHLVVCDTFGTCSQAHLPLRHPARISPWIPWTSGGLVLLGLITGIVVLLRRPPSPQKTTPSATPRGIQLRSAPPPSSEEASTDLQETLKRIMTAAEKECPRGPRIVSRMNTSIPPLAGNPGDLEKAFGNLVRLPLARAGLRGMVLVATGRGPVNMEVVLEDNGPDLEDIALRTLFDPNTARSRERQGLDRELAEAADILTRFRGHLSAEARIDGGLRLRIRLPLPAANGARENSLLK